jgi:flagellar M-ring protein FliF
VAETSLLPQPLNQLAESVGRLTPKQRLLLAGGAGLVAATLWAFVWLIGKPKYTTLYTGMSAADAQSIGARLAAKKIPYELSSDGTSVLVPSDKLDSSRLETAAQGLPRNARLGFELFDTPNWAGTDFTEQVNFQRALEGELERTIQTLSEVEGVRVHLVMPRDSLFTEQQRQAKAAVIVKSRGKLSEEAQLAIPQLVASAVDKLSPENVTLIDADSNTPLLRRHGGGTRAAYDLDEELAKALLQTLEPVVGAEHVRASVHVEYDLGTSENTEETYDPKAVAALTQQRSEETMGTSAPGGVPGTASNLPGNTAAATVVARGQESQSSRSESSTYAVSKSVRHSVQPPGRLKRIAAAVLVDDAVETQEQAGDKSTHRRKRTPEEMKEIEQLARAAIGLDATRGDLLAVENLSFQEPPAEKPEVPTKLERSRRLLTEWSGAIRYLGIAALFMIVYLLLLRPVKKQAVDAFRQLPSRLTRPGKEVGAEGAAAVSASGAAHYGEALPSVAEGAKRAETLKRQLLEKVKAEPAAASRLVQGWIREADTK